MVNSDYGGAFAYPTGPPPKCAQTVDKEFVDPDCPLITDPASPLVIPCYVAFGCLGLFVTLHVLHRLIATRRLGPLNHLTSVLVPARATISRASRADGAGDQLDDAAYGLDFSDGLTVQGYRSTWLGTAALWSVGLYVVMLLYCYLVIIVDVYHKCQWNGFWNSQCFSGDWPVFGSYDGNSNAFWVVWIVQLASCGLIVLNRDHLRDYARVPCEQRHATHASVKVPPVERGDRPHSPTLLVKFAREVEAWLRALRGDVSEWETVPVQRAGAHKYIDYHSARYVLRDGAFEKGASPLVGSPLGELVKRKGLGSADEHRALLEVLGDNRIAYKVDSVGAALVKEFFSFFYMYQFQMYIVQYWFSYWIATIGNTTIVISSGLINRRIINRHQRKIAALAEFSTECEVCRCGEWTTTTSDDLVVGDLVKVQGDEWKLPADLLLLSGAVIVNESGLTGESMPVRKFSAANADAGEKYWPQKHKRHTLYAGTVVLQSIVEGDEPHVTALVVATGIDTGRGDLVASILYPVPIMFRYEEELPILMLVLICEAAIAVGMVIVLLEALDADKTTPTLLGYASSSVMQIVNPLLPVSLVAGNAASAQRLIEDHGINCADPKRIAVAGKVRLSIFDKTGTITKEGLDFTGVRALGGARAWRPGVITAADAGGDALRGMACCHAVSRLGEQLVGLAVEVEMFKATGWALEERAGELPAVRGASDRLVLLKRFDFDHTSMTMSVVVQTGDGRAYAFCKGAPEKVGVKCTASSLPADYADVAAAHAFEGCYVLGLACKELDARTAGELERAQVESDLTFVALVLFRNEMKEDSPAALAMLKAGGVRSVMATGDNAQCADYIARKSGLIDPSARVFLARCEAKDAPPMWRETGVDGAKALSTADVEAMFPDDAAATAASATAGIEIKISSDQAAGADRPVELAIADSATLRALCADGAMERLLPHTRIWARTSPADKVLVAQMHMARGLIVAMTGDGGNDCGALRMAHVGMALSEAEASIVSPFTASSLSIMSVPQLLMEGRACLATSFATCKLLVIGGQVWALFKLAGYFYGTLVTNTFYVFFDLVLVLPLMLIMTQVKPLKTLAESRPTSSLLGIITLTSLVGHTALYAVFMSALLVHTEDIDGFLDIKHFMFTFDWWFTSDTWQSTSLAMISMLGFCALALIFSNGARFRQPLWRSYPVVAYAGFWLTFLTVLFMLPDCYLTQIFHVSRIQFNSPCAPQCYPDGEKATTLNIAPRSVEGCETCPINPAWLQWQQPLPLGQGGSPSPGMPALEMFYNLLLCYAMIVLMFAWEALVVNGPVARAAAARYPNRAPLKL